MRISVIVPARNEADRIALTIQSLLKNKPEGFTEVEIIVVDDASEDETSEIAKRSGATKVIRLNRHGGKGAALRKGIEDAGGDVILFVDADLGETAGNVWQIVAPIIDGKADMTIAVPPPDPSGGGFGLVKKFAAWAIKTTTGFNPTAPLSGQRAIKREVLERVSIANCYAVETALTIDAIRSGFRVVEIPITFGHRALGKSWRGFLHRAKQFWDIFWAVLPRLLRTVTSR
jgi:glycosyltransferase involved in cell wall biosynthesis